MTERAQTNGIEVEAQSFFIAERSDPFTGKFFFSYRIRIKNNGATAVRLLHRQWLITDGLGRVETVKGPGSLVSNRVSLPVRLLNTKATVHLPLPPEQCGASTIWRMRRDAPSRRQFLNFSYLNLAVFIDAGTPGSQADSCASTSFKNPANFGHDRKALQFVACQRVDHLESYKATLNTHCSSATLRGDDMAFTLPELPYSPDALMPHMSAETLSFHHGKHHKAYVDNLNKLVPGTEFEGKSLEEIMKKAQGPVFNNAAQIWNHTFFWHSLTPKGGGEPGGELATVLARDFGSFAAFKEKFADAAAKQFGSGWAWLVKRKDGKLDVVATSNAQNPLTDGHTPLLTLDVWEHAYYIDYRNRRPDFIAGFWSLVNWRFAEENLKRA